MQIKEVFQRGQTVLDNQSLMMFCVDILLCC